VLNMTMVMIGSEDRWRGPVDSAVETPPPSHGDVRGGLMSLPVAASRSAGCTNLPTGRTHSPFLMKLIWPVDSKTAHFTLSIESMLLSLACSATSSNVRRSRRMLRSIGLPSSTITMGSPSRYGGADGTGS
jgi:hypothetical protein